MKSIKKKAQSLVEYGLILALVAVIAIAALQLLGSKVNQAASDAGNNIQDTGKNAANAYCGAIGGTWSNGVCTPSTGSGSGS